MLLSRGKIRGTVTLWILRHLFFHFPHPPELAQSRGLDEKASGLQLGKSEERLILAAVSQSLMEMKSVHSGTPGFGAGVSCATGG